MEADWKFPAEVPGWLTLKEGTALASLARGKEVLEIGTYCGRSTICMAQTAHGVDTIDHHEGDDGTINAEVPQPVSDSLAELDKYLCKYGVEESVNILVGQAVNICPKLKDASYDLVFIDGGHDTPSVHHDTQQALRLVKPGGVIAYHDWTYPSVQDGAALGGLGARVGRALVPDGEADSLVWFRLPLVPVSQEVVEVQKICALAMPIYPTGAVIGPVVRLLQNPARTVACVALQGQGSLLANCFNMLWCRALNARKQEPRLRYFAMLHADVEPQMPFWLDVLLHELESNKADMVSAVVPIKTRQGLTSTAIGDSFDPWCPVRRLTMKEVNEQHGGIPPPDAMLRGDDEPTRPAPSPSPSKPKRRPGRGERFAVLNAFVDGAIVDLTGAETKLWLILFRDSKAATGTARTGQADIARRAGLSVRSVKLALRSLRAKGMVRLVRLGRLNAGPSVYVIDPTGLHGEA